MSVLFGAFADSLCQVIFVRSPRQKFFVDFFGTLLSAKKLIMPNNVYLVCWVSVLLFWPVRKVMHLFDAQTSWSISNGVDNEKANRKKKAIQ